MTLVWIFMVSVSVLFGMYSGSSAAVDAAVLEGAEAAVKLCLSIGGAICLWSGIMEVMSRSGLSDALRRILSPVLRLLFPSSSHHDEIMRPLGENISANLLGLGNAATASGIQAAAQMKAFGVESELRLLVVMNTASLQLLPTTIAAVRASCGASNPFDIIPCVWISSIISVSVGITAVKSFGRTKKRLV